MDSKTISVALTRHNITGALQARVDRFCQHTAQQALNAVRTRFPIKIDTLEGVKKHFDAQAFQAMNDTDWVRHSLASWHEPGRGTCTQDSSRRPSLLECFKPPEGQQPGQMIATNVKAHGLVERVKPMLLDLLDQVDQLTLSIHVLLPCIQEGNNFGVEVQYKALALLQSIEEQTSGLQQDLSNYYYRRQRSIQLMVCHPHIQDYGQYYRLSDCSYLTNPCIHTIEHIYASYVILHDFVHKHIELIANPRAGQ